MGYSSYFQNKTVWVTGASSGIGEQLVYLLNAAGARLVISARRTEELERVKAACSNSAEVFVVPMDLSSEVSVHSAFGQASSTVGSIDVLFSNGGISQRAEALDTSLNVTRKIFEINFFSNVLLSQLVGTKMKQQGDGHIVITSTLLGKWGFYLRSSYSASKHALHGYYDSLRMEIEKNGVRVTLITPGFIHTDISKHAFDSEGKPTESMDDNQAGGISAAECAKRMLQGVASGKTEFGVGGNEINGLWVKRLFPKMFERILRRRSAK